MPPYRVTHDHLRMHTYTEHTFSYAKLDGMFQANFQTTK